MTTYAAGLRAGEVIRLKPEHINSKRMLIKVEGKGKKDRYTMLSVKLLDELRCYYKKCCPKTYLFPSTYKKKPKPLSYESVRSIYEKARKKAGVKNGGGIHTLRHSGVYPPLEGHASSRTRTRYQKNTSAVGPFKTVHHHDLSACEPRNPVKSPQSPGSYRQCKQGGRHRWPKS